MPLTAATDRFEGLSSAGLAFLEELGAYQDRAWFQDNRDCYERDVRAPLAALVDGSPLTVRQKSLLRSTVMT